MWIASGEALAFTGQPKPAHWPPFMHFARPSCGRLLIAIGSGNGCSPSCFAPASSRREDGR